jgi:hypothetical protein
MLRSEFIIISFSVSLNSRSSNERTVQSIHLRGVERFELATAALHILQGRSSPHYGGPISINPGRH